MESQYVHKIADKEYVVINELITSKSGPDYKRKINDWGGIVVGLEVDRSWLGPSYVKLTILMPVDKIFDYQKR